MYIEELKKLGNIEFLDYFLAMYFRKFGYVEDQFGWGHCAFEYEGLSKGFITKTLKTIKFEELYRIFLIEAQNRGLDGEFLSQNAEVEHYIYDGVFDKWQFYMNTNPIYIREIYATDNLGDSSVNNEFDLIMLDKPVREACVILNNKGYYTYWSSANINDANKRKGDVIQDKSVGYILIDPRNLSDELKEKLVLNGNCKFWGRALGHSDNGRYYGIWSEITSEDMLCNDLSGKLSIKALELPSLVKDQDMEHVQK